jgi:hypothetical protein
MNDRYQLRSNLIDRSCGIILLATFSSNAEDKPWVDH